jgi:hypothetical protein
MKALHYLFIMLLSMYSCTSNQQKTVADWNYIEVTSYDGWSGGSTISIKKDMTFINCRYEIISSINNCACFTSKLTKNQTSQINQFIKSIKSTKIDSLYDGRCEDCGGHLLTIEHEKRTIKSSIIGRNKFNNTVDSLTEFLVALDFPDQNSLDSCYIFTSTRSIIPPTIDVGDFVEFPTEAE